MKKIKRTKKRSEGYIKRLQRREQERNTICSHGHPLLRCWTCRQKMILERNPNTIFIKGN